MRSQFQALGFTFALIIPLAAVFYLNRVDTQRQLRHNETLVRQNEQLTKDLNKERLDRQKAQDRFAAEQCKLGEQRDIVIVQQNNALLAILNHIPQDQRNLFIDRLVQSLQDTNNILEPINEPDCKVGAS